MKTVLVIIVLLALALGGCQQIEPPPPSECLSCDCPVKPCGGKLP